MMANTNAGTRPKKSSHDVSEYGKFSTDLGGMVCTSCHETIKNRDLVIALNVGSESDRLPIKDYLRFTGIIYHFDCIDLESLPGIAGRDGFIDELLEHAYSGSAEANIASPAPATKNCGGPDNLILLKGRRKAG